MTQPAPTASEQPTEADLAYLAGFFDGEGAIGIYKGGAAQRNLYVQVSQKVRGPLDKYAKFFGGTVYHRKNNYGGIYQWVLVGRKASTLLVALLPYLELRKSEAELAIEFQTIIPERKPGRQDKVTPEQAAEREAYAERLAVLRQARRTTSEHH